MEDLSDELEVRTRVLLGELKDRSLWFVKVRWWVPPAILAGLCLAWITGLGMTVWPLLCTAAFILCYNLALSHWHRRFAHEPALQSENTLRRFTQWQVILDYLAMFVFVHFTGGVSSPFIFFFIFHLIFASILLKHHVAHAFAAAAALGMGILALGESLGFLERHALRFRGEPIHPADLPLSLLVKWALFTASAFISTLATTNIMEMVRRRILNLADLSTSVMVLNGKLDSLRRITRSMVSTRRLDPVLDRVCEDLTRVMGMQGVSVKLLSRDGKRLRFAASYGLRTEIPANHEIDIEKSPVNRCIIDGEPYLSGNVKSEELALLGENLNRDLIRSILFVPLHGENRVIGILGAYCRHPDRFDEEDVEFFRLAAELSGIAVENAHAYESVESMARERKRFLLRAAHNLRAPLVAVVSNIEVLKGGYLGALNDAQQEHLHRIDRRTRSMITLIGELLALADHEARETEKARRPESLVELAERIRRTFQDRASKKGIRLEVETLGILNPFPCHLETLEQILENLVANAINYGREGGRVGVTFQDDPGGGVEIRVEDDGIGIPEKDLPRIFDEFFRAPNAKANVRHGTGLGLAIVKESVERYGGRIVVESEEGEGTRFHLHLPRDAASEEPVEDPGSSGSPGAG